MLRPPWYREHGYLRYGLSKDALVRSLVLSEFLAGAKRGFRGPWLAGEGSLEPLVHPALSGGRAAGGLWRTLGAGLDPGEKRPGAAQR